jgi:hypothetical protein
MGKGKGKGTSGKLVVEIQEDGSMKTNAREVVGEDADIMALLEELAELAGGDLKVEKHVGHHSHSHTHAEHHHGKGGHKH